MAPQTPFPHDRNSDLHRCSRCDSFNSHITREYRGKPSGFVPRPGAPAPQVSTTPDPEVSFPGGVDDDGGRIDATSTPPGCKTSAPAAAPFPDSGDLQQHTVGAGLTRTGEAVSARRILVQLSRDLRAAAARRAPSWRVAQLREQIRLIQGETVGVRS